MRSKHKVSLMAFLLTIIIAVSIALTVALAADEVKPAPVTEVHEDNPLLRDAEIYAKHQGVTVDEAIRRFELQDAAGALDAALSKEEAETFAGLWIEHAPKFRIVVQFTRDAEETIRPYLQNDLVPCNTYNIG